MTNCNQGTRLSRWLCLLLALSLLLPGTSLAESLAQAESWGYVIVHEAMFRPQAGVSDYIEKLPIGLAAKILGTQKVGDHVWYQVSALTPLQPTILQTGFLREDVFRPMTAPEQAAYLAGQPRPTPTPVPTPAPTAVPLPSGYIKITKPGTNLRITPGGNTQLQMGVNLVLPMLGAPAQALGYTWAYVRHTNGTMGYVRSDCFVYTDAQGNPAAAPAPIPGPVPTAAPALPQEPSAGYITLIKGGVNLREQPGGKSLTQLDRNTVLPFYGFAQQGGYTWYYVYSTRGAGYIRSDMARLSDGSGVPPIATPTPAGTPGQVIGYVVTTKSDVNLRRTPTTTGQVFTQVPRNTVWPLINPVVNNQGYAWYFVQVNDRTGYLRGDCVRQLSSQEVTAYLAGGMPGQTPPPADPGQTIGHIITTATSLNIRMAPSLSATQVTQLPNAGAVFAYSGTVASGGTTWYRILIDNQVAYILGRYARVMTALEYQSYIDNLPTPVPTPSPAPQEMSNIAVTRMDRVLVRETPSASGKSLTVLYRQGTVVNLKGPTQSADNYLWYSADAGGVAGWLRGDVIRVLTKAEAEALVPTIPDSGPGTGTPQEASYPTLVRGATGAAVTRLQTELVRLTFLPAGAITGVYTTQTVEAVKNYQRAAGLFIDGIAGANTQHKMYGTVPVGTYNPPPGGTVLFPVEKVDWVTGAIQTVWPNGRDAVLTDVRTGLTFTIRRWAGGGHADVEPLTSADTAIMCRVYGVSSAQQIADRNLYQRRPVWITVGGRSFAASIYGVPHNYPQGDTIKDNDFNGQFCVHFINSRTHASQAVDQDHQSAIQEAYDKAPSRK